MSNLVEQLELELARSYNDLRFFGRFFFEDRFTRPFDKIHKDIFDVVNDKSAKVKIIAAPRGIGKTSIANLAIPAHGMLFADYHYIVPVSATYTLAQQQSENLKKKLRTNKLIKGLYGNVTTTNFSKEQWVVNITGSHDVVCMPRGRGNQIRGLLYDDYRPDLIIVDDLEDPVQVRSEEQRKHLKDWFFSDLMNCVDRGSDNWQIIVVGTVLHSQALLVELLEMADQRDDWLGVRLEICDDDFVSNAPSFMSDKECFALYKSLKDSNKLDTWYRDYKNLPVAIGDDGEFQQNYFQYYEEKDYNLNRDPYTINIVIYDPAKTTKENSADSGVVGVGVDVTRNVIRVRDTDSGKWYPDEAYQKVLDMANKINARAIAVEHSGLGEFVMQPIRDFLFRNRWHGEIIPLTAKKGTDEKGKVLRVRSLIPYYRQGLVYHNKTACEKLEGQLLSFPSPKLWDLADPLGYIPQLMDEAEIFMMPYDGSIRDNVEDEFAELLVDEFGDSGSHWSPRLA